MGLFNNKDKQASAPPAPGMPPAPNAALPTPPAPETSNEIVSSPGLPTPPLPGASLEDIKQQVSNSEEIHPSNELAELPSPMPPSTEMAPMEKQSSSSNNDDELDSLFDISDLELPESDDPEEHLEPEANLALTHEEHNQEVKESDSNVEFIAHHKELNETKPFFVTTSQFKGLLEIIENVKQKTKESSERHLRLLDIKSEEDIEYENLKKDFAFIEDKLYEVDTLIFEND
jgi:hypothetical protein